MLIGQDQSPIEDQLQVIVHLYGVTSSLGEARNSVVARSNAEVEYRAMAHGVC